VAFPRTIALDGPAGSGKSSVAASLASDLGYLFVDTGAFYRGVTLAAIQQGQVEADDPVLVTIAEGCHMEISADRDADAREYTLHLNGEDVTWAIREPGVEAHVSRVSAIGGVRKVLNDKYRALASTGPVIMVGRDIGTVVLPDADLKIYLDASAETRAQRRYHQRIAAKQPANYDDILAALRARDTYDSQRAIAPLRLAESAQHVHTDDLDVAGVVNRLKQMVMNWQP
jgi:CMP/dCMP kinase